MDLEKLLASADAACSQLADALPDGCRFVLVNDGATGTIVLVSPDGDLVVNEKPVYSDCAPGAVQVVDMDVAISARSGARPTRQVEGPPMLAKFRRGAFSPPAP